MSALPPPPPAAAEPALPPACLAESACWPDAVTPRRAVLDDVSRLNAAEAGVVVQPRTLADVQAALALARATGRRVVMRGTKHSMGGQSLCDDAVALDMAFVNAVRYDAVSNTYRAGAGATWADVITVLNAHGRAPRTLQSYATFSVGGTLSVTGHGITLQLDDGSGRTYQLREGANVIGRGQDAQFRLPDTGVSRRHVEVRWDGQVALLSDLNSTNGTTVNNAPVQEWQLADGDVIRVGHSEIIVRVH